MKPSSLSEIKRELQELSPSKVAELCIHLAKFRKENKELLTYLIFEADDEVLYLKNVKNHLDELFLGLNSSSVFLAKKTVRKVLRIAKKHITFCGTKQAEAELLIHFCKLVKNAGLPLHSGTALGNLYQRQISTIHKALSALHDDLQFDYSEELKILIK